MRKPPPAAEGQVGPDASLSTVTPPTRLQARTTFGMAFALMTMDFVDRQVVVATFPYLKMDWGLSDTQLGGLVSVVAVAVAAGALPTALLADRWSRVKAIAVMGTIWSLATLACAFTQNVTQLFAARAVVGAGEAGYAPAAGALLATVFPPGRRATVLGAFQAAAPLGSVLGLVLGGFVAANWGWRAAFGLMAIPGLVLALAFLGVRDYRTIPVSRAGAGPTRRLRSTVTKLVRVRSGIAAVAGGALQLMMVSTLYTWLPSYLNRSSSMPAEQASTLTATVIIAGMVGSVAFGYLADRLAARDRRARLLVPAALSIVTLVLLTTAFAVLTAGPWQIALLVAGGLTTTAAVGPVAAVATDVVHPGARATAISIVSVSQNMLGLAVGPVLTGLFSDLYGLPTALAVMSTASGVAALAFWYGSRHYVRDGDAASPTTIDAQPV